MMEERIKALIIQYDNLVRYRKKLLDCNLAETLLSIIPICVNNQDKLEAHINQKIDECRRIKIRLQTARCKVSKLYAKYKDNTQVKEFLDFAIFLSPVGDSNEEIITLSNSEDGDLLQLHNTSLKVHFTDEFINDEKPELESVNLLNEEETFNNGDVFTLTSKLNEEKFQREYFESERDKLDYLSDKLCYLLHKYEQRVRLLEKNETSGTNVQMSSHPIKIEEDMQIDNIIHSVVELDNESFSSPANFSSEKNDSDFLLLKKKEYDVAETVKPSDLPLRNCEPVRSFNFLNHVLYSSPIVRTQPPLKTSKVFDIEFIDVNNSVDDCESIVEKCETVDELKTTVQNTISFQPLKMFENPVSFREPDEDVHVLSQRKRKMSEENDTSYRRNEMRPSRLRSTPYVNYSNNGVEAVYPIDEICCQNRCFERISAKNRAEIFTNFQEFGDENSQDAYLQSLIQIVEYEVKRFRRYKHWGGTRVRNPTDPVMHTTQHKFRVNTSAGPRLVCKQTFVKIHNVSSKRVLRLCKLLENGIYLGRMFLPLEEEEEEVLF